MSEMKKHAKSFSLAALFFPQGLHRSVERLYAWCRHCDDVIDEGRGSFEGLLEETQRAYALSVEPLSTPFMDLRTVVTAHRIPSVYVTDLLEGMRMDEEGRNYETYADVLRYSYHVAGTVGLMMCHLMGLYDQKALKEAATLGMAMQLTNISRDVREDAERGRCYIPDEWVRTEGMWSAVVLLIGKSEKLYEEGRSGIRHLPLTAAAAVTIASLLYREIGREILRAGPVALTRRTVVPRWRKALLVARGLFEVLASLPARIRDRRRLTMIDTVWRPA